MKSKNETSETCWSRGLHGTKPTEKLQSFQIQAKYITTLIP